MAANAVTWVCLYLGGAFATADKRIEVFGTHGCVFVPNNQWACDHVEHILFPLDTWGKEFVAVRPAPRNAATPEPAYYRIMASEADTRITMSPDPTGVGVRTLGAGAFIEFMSTLNFKITGDKPIQVGQFLVSQNATGLAIEAEAGDPSFIMLAPSEQFRKDYTFLIPAAYASDYVTIVAPPDATINLDGTSYDSNTFTAVDLNSRFRQLPLADGVHSLVSNKAVGLYVYGYSQYVSYGYVAGLDLAEINPKP